jgi:hypothetical protein
MFEDQTKTPEGAGKIDDIFAGVDSVPQSPSVQMASGQPLPEAPKEPFDQLANAGNHGGNRLFLIGGVVVFLLILAVAVWLALSKFTPKTSQMENEAAVLNESPKMIQEQAGIVKVPEAEPAVQSSPEIVPEAAQAVVATNSLMTGSLPQQLESTSSSSPSEASAATTSESATQPLNVGELSPEVAVGQVDQPIAEQIAGLKTDTDGDGLSDQEEKALGIYTDRSDTDDDGLSDYEEVKVYFTSAKNPDTDGDGYNDGSEVKSGYNPNGQGKLLK